MIDRIIIPTLGRVNRQKTWDMLPDVYKRKTVFVTNDAERAALRQSTGHQEILVQTGKGVPNARQDACDAFPGALLWFMDDDLSFFRRAKDWTQKKPVLDLLGPTEVGEALDTMGASLKNEYAAVAMAHRGFNQSLRERYFRLCGRMMISFGVDTNILESHGIRFDQFEFWEDFHVTLELLKRGYPNQIWTDYVYNSITNMDGGVSLYRTRKALIECREKFVRWHAPFAQPVDKNCESWPGEEWKTNKAPDVRINWRQAYASHFEDKE